MQTLGTIIETESERERGRERGRGREGEGIYLLEYVSLEAEVEPHTLCSALLIGGGERAEPRVIRLSRSVPRGHLQQKDSLFLSFFFTEIDTPFPQ